MLDTVASIVAAVDIHFAGFDQHIVAGDIEFAAVVVVVVVAAAAVVAVEAAVARLPQCWVPEVWSTGKRGHVYDWALVPREENQLGIAPNSRRMPDFRVHLSLHWRPFAAPRLCRDPTKLSESHPAI